VGQVVEDIDPLDPLLLEEVHREAVRFLEQRDDHVRPGDDFAPGALDVRGGACQGALDPAGQLRLDVRAVRDRRGVLVEEREQPRAQLRDVGTRVAQHLDRDVVEGQRREQVLEPRELVPAVGGVGQRDRQGDLQLRGQLDHGSGSAVRRSGMPLDWASSVTAATLLSATSRVNTPATPEPL